LPKLPVVSGRELVKALERAGFEFLRQRGSHVTMVNRDKGRTAVVPVHSNKDLPKGALAHILRGSGLTSGDLRRLLK